MDLNRFLLVQIAHDIAHLTFLKTHISPANDGSPRKYLPCWVGHYGLNVSKTVMGFALFHYTMLT